MKRIMFAIPLLLIFACRGEQQETPPPELKSAPPPVVNNIKPPDTKIGVPPPDLTLLQTQMTEVSNSIADLRKSIDESRTQFKEDMEQALKQTNASMSAVKTSLTDTRREVEELKTKYALSVKEQEQRLAEVESRQQMLQETETRLERAQEQYDKKIAEVAAQLNQINSYSIHAAENSDLAILALRSIGDKKAGGILGIGRKQLLSDEILRRLDGKVPMPPPSGIAIQPPKPKS
ncbi:MAG: hypothetical protein KW802_01290 [Candidatus Doudnabacteria bacterium]|nr:hypothetical protein [Candidatus Doudnabacteria bacterium]